MRRYVEEKGNSDNIAAFVDCGKVLQFYLFTLLIVNTILCTFVKHRMMFQYINTWCYVQININASVCENIYCFLMLEHIIVSYSVLFFFRKMRSALSLFIPISVCSELLS